ncbi:MAG: tetratricopeptide repeat protein [Deltaproteobacteria bacterium]|nr:tetratricopeptide repeat protein [Deltaproteobacteria bacterium]
MLSEDPQKTHLASADDIVELYESTNQPLVQSQGRAAQSAQGVVVATQVGGGMQVLMVLTLLDEGTNVVYAGELVGDAEVPQQIEDAMMFAESMGFILDNTGWPGLDAGQRAELIARLGAFKPPQRKKQVVAVQRAKAADPLATVARLFGAFGAVLCLTALGCSGPTAEQRRTTAEIHYDLGSNLVNAGNAQGALAEYMEALKSDDEIPQIHNALGLLYGFSLNQAKEAEQHFKRAIELDENFSEAYNNYGAFLLGQKRYAEAAPQFEKALTNPLYAQRAVAETNLGWTLYKSGQTDKGISRIRAVLTVSPKYCKGWRQLGTIFEETQKLDDAAEAYDRYTSTCPDSPDAWMVKGKLLARLQKGDEARASFLKCEELSKAADPNTSAECKRLVRELGAP